MALQKLTGAVELDESYFGTATMVWLMLDRINSIALILVLTNAPAALENILTGWNKTPAELENERGRIIKQYEKWLNS